MSDHSFNSFVLDQLRTLPELRTQAMFGGHGLYQAERFFGILMAGRLYFKANDQTRTVYVARGMGPFIYEKAARTMAMSYYEVPPDVLECGEALVVWAKRAIGVATASRKKPARKRKPPANPRLTGPSNRRR